ncbi:MAG: PQQ-dependent sugar dehydrogenase [Bacteroidia bacterium]|nr:PQQ-dependent sugar dehydrogenase [Bacteroidia bacterium]NND52197.1 T9SS type A sorting domain-containing protein [Flavobacteriaceae bacterium]
MKKINLSLLCCLIWYMSSAQPEIALDAFGSGFNAPISITNAGDERLFITERRGAIQILNVDGTTNPVPFLDIDPIVIPPGGAGDEGGLLGLAFHPDYLNNGYFYVNYINNSGNTVISRFNVSAGDPDIADPNSEFILLTIGQPFPNHNGGDIAFGPNGYLYIGMGDGGSGGDPGDRAQNLSLLLGKMLRIDVDNGTPYGIPPDNPFFNDGDPNTLDEIWAYGLRNPWRFSFDSQTGDIWIGDVGQGIYEEIDMAAATAAGLNYGWRCYEANTPFNTTGCPDMSTMTFPVGVYTHNSSGLFKCSITGGYRYRGSDNPDFVGVYFFADFCSDEIGALVDEGGGSWTMSFSDPYNGQGWVGFGEDMNGELYVAGLNTGEIYKVVDANLSTESFELNGFKMYPNPAEDLLNFDFTHNLPLEIRIFDLHGKLTINQTDFSSHSLSISTESLASGMYIVQVKGIDGNMTYKKLLVN